MDKNIFNQVQFPRLQTNTFDLSHQKKMSFNMGELIPTCWIECLPGDHFTLSCENMLRMAPMVNPLMHEINVTTHYFFVRYSLLWPNFEDFITGKSTPSWPYIVGDGGASFQDGDLIDYLEYPTGQDTNGYNISAMPIAAYALIFDEFYRSDQVQTVDTWEELADGNNAWAKTFGRGNPRKVAWEHDYFTAALPTPQAGSSSVTLPLLADDTVDVTLKSGDQTLNPPKLFEDINDGTISTGDITAGGAGTNTFLVGNEPSVFDPNGTLEVDINATANTITTLRRAMKLQEFLERDSRGGLRYNENMLAHFGQMTSDARLFRPEFIGGTKQRMVISEVLSTAQTYDSTNGDVPVGALAGHGISVGGGNTFTYKVQDHGMIMGLIFVRPTTSYHQGLHRKFMRFTREDHYWPSFANIGEQGLLKREVYCDTSTNTVEELDEVFGYIPRYSEYKYYPSNVHGDFRTSLDSWHLSRQFSTAPALNGAFIECTPSDRIFAVQDGSDTIYAHIFNKVIARRKMPVFGNPSI